MVATPHEITKLTIPQGQHKQLYSSSHEAAQRLSVKSDEKAGFHIQISHQNAHARGLL
jgi:hypothetical protein